MFGLSLSIAIAIIIATFIVFVIILVLMHKNTKNFCNKDCNNKMCPLSRQFFTEGLHDTYRHIYVGNKLAKLDPELRSLYVKYMIMSNMSPIEFEKTMYKKFKGKKLS